MAKYKIISIWRLSVSLIILSSIFVQIFSSTNVSIPYIINFLSYFTILSNLFAAGSFIYLVLKPKTKNADLIRGASVLYILVTGFGFSILFGGGNQMLIWWVNIVVHYVAPVVVLVDWLIIPHQKISYKKALIWISFPVFYVIYTFLRGVTINWYPYEFLNPNSVGYNQFLVYIVGIALGMLVLIGVIVKIGRK